MTYSVEVGCHLLLGAGELRPLGVLPGDVWLVCEGVQREVGGTGQPPGVGQSPGEGRQVGGRKRYGVWGGMGEVQT